MAAPTPQFLVTLRNDAAFWSRTYQTTSDAKKEQDFVDDVIHYVDSAKGDEIRAVIDKARPAFAGDMGTSPETLCRLLLCTALHESEGGKFDRQIGGGPARGWWQVEPASARSIVVNSAAMWGKRATQITGASLARLSAMTDTELGDFLLAPVNCCVMAAFITLTNAKGKGQLAYLRK
jgi:hypothetical protein